MYENINKNKIFLLKMKKVRLVERKSMKIFDFVKKVG